ncbi:hypothetical protein EB796_002395 [Bugula neritina]|uniref:Uncharacterized protein n=1 Tax=Bugula neritina TaxID=10212 RepID=A0A7J7KMB6_BUGNE|nr:hypothetical protein EB796_002395 [Bugula neritina]
MLVVNGVLHCLELPQLSPQKATPKNSQTLPQAAPLQRGADGYSSMKGPAKSSDRKFCCAHLSHRMIPHLSSYL